VPREVKREVWGRDAGQCAFVSANISLRCWRHNHYEGELIFGPQGSSIVREAGQSFGLARSAPSRPD
jgi:hypothetical protein